MITEEGKNLIRKRIIENQKKVNKYALLYENAPLGEFANVYYRTMRAYMHHNEALQFLLDEFENNKEE